MKITPIESQLTPGGQLNVRRANGSDFGLDTRETEYNMAQLSAHIQRREEEDAAVSVAKAVAEDRTATDGDLQASMDSAPAGAPEFTKGFIARYDERLQKRLDAMDNPVARRLMEIKGAEIRAGYAEQAARFESTARRQKIGMDLESISDQYSNLVSVNPGQYGTLRQEMDAAIASSGLNGNAKQELRTKALASMASSMYMARISKDPYGVMSELEKGEGAMKDLPGGMVTRLMAMAENQIKHDSAVGKHAVIEDTQRSIELLQQGYDVPESQREAILSVFGDDPDRRDDLVQAFDNAKQFGDTVRASAMASPEEIAEMAQGYDLTAANMDEDLTNRENALKNGKRFEAVVRQRNQQIEKDPAGYVIANSEATNEAFKAFMDVQQNPDAPEAEVAAARANYVNNMKADQSRLGWPNTTLFTDKMVEQVKDKIGSIERTPQGAKQVVGMLSGLHEDWGADWPAVYSQLRTKKALDGAIDAVAYMAFDRRADATILATAWANKDTLEKMVADDAKKDINDALETEAMPLSTAMANEGRSDQFVSFKNAAKLLAMQYVAEGQTPSSAAKTAFDKVVGTDYTVIGKTRFPKSDAKGVAIDPDTMLEGAMIAKKSIVDQISLKSMAGQSDESIAAELPYHIEDAYWVTANGNQGLQLKWKDTVPAETKDGKPVIFTWDQLREFSINQKADLKKQQLMDDLDEAFGTGKYAPKPRKSLSDGAPE